MRPLSTVARRPSLHIDFTAGRWILSAYSVIAPSHKRDPGFSACAFCHAQSPGAAHALFSTAAQSTPRSRNRQPPATTETRVKKQDAPHGRAKRIARTEAKTEDALQTAPVRATRTCRSFASSAGGAADDDDTSAPAEPAISFVRSPPLARLGRRTRRLLPVVWRGPRC